MVKIRARVNPLFERVPMVSMVKILAGVNLLFTLASAWSMAFLIFQAVINFAIVASGMMRRKPESTMTSSAGVNYGVFLSFRGVNTRKGFTDHLYSRLIDAGIRVFRDTENLDAGEHISSSLKEAINQSTISIAILSKDYASSKSCLEELQQMWECRGSNGQTIIPIFYDISPSDVKYQTGSFGRSFNKHERDGVDTNIIKTWKKVLRMTGELSGYDRENINGGHESQLVNDVLTRVRELLKMDDQVVPDELVGIDLHVQEIMTKLGDVSSQGEAKKVSGGDVRVVGIWGFQGVGKTTLARVIFNKMRTSFEECVFLENINSEGVVSSQERLIASLTKRKRESLNSSNDGIKTIENLVKEVKVLIVLDDVREFEQIKGLVGKLTWFGRGSRIIVTTDRKGVLNHFDHGAVEDYKVEPMKDQHALQLFRKHAFQGVAPQDDFQYDSRSIEVVKAIGGLPKAIEIQASYLSKKRDDIEAWTNTLDSLRRHPSKGAKTLLDIGYESLDHREKKIFLDIACFFVGNDERIPIYMWKACDCYPSTGIDPLRNLLWLENGENNELRMDGMIRDFGRDIVKSKLVHKRCRLWNPSDALSILENRTGSKRVEGINLAVEDSCTDTFEWPQFWKMPNLRYLRLDRAKIQGDTMKLPPNLRWLEWPACPLMSELCNVHLKELVILNLSGSQVNGDSQVWKRIIEKAEKLKVLNLQGCGLSPTALDFPAPVDLERLILEGSTDLFEIETFVSKLEKLKSLNLRNCKNVKELPKEDMKSLTELLIDGTGITKIQIQNGCLKKLEVLSACECGHLRDISTIGHLRNLSSLHLDGADIDGLPDTFEFHQTLVRLSLRECKKLGELPTSIGKLEKLEVLDLSGTIITEMPESVKDLRNLKTLKMARTSLREFPKDIVNLKNLEEIDFSSCISLEGRVRCDISRLSSLRILKLSSSNITGLPKRIHDLTRLQILYIDKCNQLHALPKLPSSLRSLRWESKKMTITDLSDLTNLKELVLTDGEQPEAGGLMMLLNILTSNMGWMTRLESLETLKLSLPQVTNLPRKLSALTQVRELSLSCMKKLDLTQLPSASSLSTLRLKNCKIRKPIFSSLKYLSELELEDCYLAEIDGLEDLKFLEVLKISQCSGITNLNGLKDLRHLRKVKIHLARGFPLPKLSGRVQQDVCFDDSFPSVA